MGTLAAVEGIFGLRRSEFESGNRFTKIVGFHPLQEGDKNKCYPTLSGCKVKVKTRRANRKGRQLFTFPAAPPHLLHLLCERHEV